MVTGSCVSLASTSGGMPGPLSVKRIHERAASTSGSCPSSIRKLGCAAPRRAMSAFLVRVQSTR